MPSPCIHWYLWVKKDLKRAGNLQWFQGFGFVWMLSTQGVKGDIRVFFLGDSCLRV